jgi:DNA processing protein
MVSHPTTASDADTIPPSSGFEIDLIERGTSRYPEQLLDLSHVPKSFFCIGDTDLLAGPMIAIVGTRDPTSYGERTTRELARAFANNGVTLVSGMARGIDAIVHRTALDCDGKTIAVLGTGIDIPYPSGHRELHRSIASRGLVISENGPGVTPYKGAFPRRNRIIAALGRATIVIEAGHKSGALNTASHAMEIGRPVAALPGPIDSPQSAGTNHLIRDGAIVIASVDDALALMGLSGAPAIEPIQLSDIEARVWSALGGSSIQMDALAFAAKLSARECMTVVTMLELRGLVECLVSGEVRRR